MNTVRKSSRKGSRTGSSMKPLSSAISEHSSIKGTPEDIKTWLTSSRRDFPVSRFHAPESEKAQTMNETCGLQPSNVFARYDRDSRSWKTYPALFPADTLPPFSATWPKAGITVDGVSYRQPKWEQTICGDGYGCLLPTITATEWKGAKSTRYQTADADGFGWRRVEAVRKQGDGIYIHPNYAEAVMMWPIMWTDLKPLATDKFREWLQQHGDF